MKYPKPVSSRAWWIAALLALLAGYGLLFAAESARAPVAKAELVEAGVSSFADFCKQNPLAGKPLGKDRLILEVLAVEVELPRERGAANAAPAAPTPAMLGQGVLRQRIYANSFANTENMVAVGRRDDGSADEATLAGQRLFTRLEQTDTGYALTFAFSESHLVGWVDIPAAGLARLQPIIDSREMNSKVNLKPDGQWTRISGATRTAEGAAGAPRRLGSFLYIRLIEDPAAPRLPVTPVVPAAAK